MESQYVKLVPTDPPLAEQVVDYYERNHASLRAFEPIRSEEFFLLEYRRAVLKKEVVGYEVRTAFRYYIVLTEQPSEITGIIRLSNVVWGTSCPVFLGHKLDKGYVNGGCMFVVAEMLTKHAFEELGLHRIKADIVLKNKTFLRVLEKNQLINEGISRHYLNISGVWKNHTHMAKINYAMY